MSNTFVVESFVNSIGQTVNPGDDVVYVGSSWSNTSVNTGKFAGVYKDKNGKPQAVKVAGVHDHSFRFDKTLGCWGRVPVVRSVILPRMRVFKISKEEVDIVDVLKNSL